jgi:hypothetical protein
MKKWSLGIPIATLLMGTSINAYFIFNKAPTQPYG